MRSLAAKGLTSATARIAATSHERECVVCIADGHADASRVATSESHTASLCGMESYEELTGLTDEQLIAIFNQDRQNVSVGKQWYIDEITRRRTDRASEALVRLTRQLAALTVVIALLTAVGAAAAVVAALRSG